MIDKDKLDQLSTLVNLFVTCSEKGGTPVFTRIQALVGEDIKELLTELEEAASAADERE